MTDFNDRLKKLHALRMQRERLSRGRMLFAKGEVIRSQDAVEEAKHVSEEVRGESYEQIRAALRNAESVRDPSARFAGIAMTMWRNRNRIDDAEEDVVERTEDADAARTASKTAARNYLLTLRARTKFDALLNRLDRGMKSRREMLSEDEVSEIHIVDPLR